MQWSPPLVDRLSQLTGDVTLAGVARGDLLVRGATHWQNVAVGAAGRVLTVTDVGGGVLEPRWAVPASGVTDHGLLTGLGDDDHTQYHTDARGDARYVNVTGDVITPSGVGVVGLRIDEPAGYTANALEIRNSAAAIIAMISAAGQGRFLNNGLRVNRSDNADLESTGFYGTISYLAANGFRFNDNAGAVVPLFSNNFASAAGGINYALDLSASDRIALRAGHATNWVWRARVSNLALFNAESFGGGTGVLFVANASVVPTTNPTGGAIWYVEAGATKIRGSSGTITTIAPA